MPCTVRFNFDEDDLFSCIFLSLVVNLLGTIRLSDGATVNESSAALYRLHTHMRSTLVVDVCIRLVDLSVGIR